MDNTIEFSWSEHKRSDRENASDVKVNTTIEMDTREIERIFRKLLMGDYQNMSKKGVQEKLKDRASKVEVEKIHYNSVL